MHIDGLRVDAVASMLYLDYGRENGEWIPNKYGGKENLEAIEFFKHLKFHRTSTIPGSFDDCRGIDFFSRRHAPIAIWGLGFDMKWNMGWMNDTLRYFSKDPIYRQLSSPRFDFWPLYAFTEKFTLALSHDEVVHGKKSFLSKMPGDIWQKFANCRLLFSYLICQPGKKLTFMGLEIGLFDEWWIKTALNWSLLEYGYHYGLQKMVKDLNHFYLKTKELWEKDFDYTGFSWVDFSDMENSLIAYLRKSQNPEKELLCVHHFTPNYYPKYRLHLPNVKHISESFNSDAIEYGGSGKTPLHIQLSQDAIEFELPPLATVIFEVRF